MAPSMGMTLEEINEIKCFQVIRKREPSGKERVELECTCSGCGRKISNKLDRSESDYKRGTLIYEWQRSGWSIDIDGDGDAKCPHCVRGQLDSRVVPIMKRTAETIRAERNAFNLLDAHFNKKDGAYGAGWSDAIIAEKTGLSESAVKDMREAAYGILKVPTEIQQALADLGLMRADLARLQQEVTDLTNRMIKAEASLRKYAA